MALLRRTLYLLGLLCLWTDQTYAMDTPPSSPIDPTQITVSGLSSGAFMAQQIHVAYSDIFKGVGSIAGGPYGCFKLNEGDLRTALLPRSWAASFWCLSANGLQNYAAPKANIAFAEKMAEQGKIAPLSHLEDSRVFLFNSKEDKTVDQGQGDASYGFYEHFVKESDQLLYQNTLSTKVGDFRVAHGIPTSNPLFQEFDPDEERGCALENPNSIATNATFIYYCQNYPKDEDSLIGQMLKHLYGGLEKPKPFSNAQFFKIRQSEYVEGLQTVDDLNRHSLDEFAYAYIPESCQSAAPCKLHVAFHGCRQYPSYEFEYEDKNGQKITRLFGNTLYRNVYNTFAEANNMIVLYPQAHNVGFLDISPNPRGCWDFWGQFVDNTDEFFTREARQMKMVAKMVQAFQDQSIRLERLPWP